MIYFILILVSLIVGLVLKTLHDVNVKLRELDYNEREGYREVQREKQLDDDR